jgi:diguanylate cyclase (GGDEF)-like protein/PAS domain S-box-containing protein
MNPMSVLSGSYDYRLVALSIVLAGLVWYAALVLAERVSSAQGGARAVWLSTGATVIGAGIWAMHYIGISTLGVAAIGASSLVVLGVAIASSLFDRLMAVRKVDLSAARERELYFKTMAEAVPEIIWTANPDGMDDYFNQQCFDYTGLTLEQLRGAGWEVIIHPDDLNGCMSKWKNALRTGDPYDVEYRLQGKDGSYRWFLCRANPIRNPEGEIVKWFGTCTDIESQKQNQQILEEQILERTIQLADTNARLQEEMLAKDFARRELDQQNERMMEQLTKRSERATMLAKMGELLQSCISRDEVFAAALGFAPKIFPAARGAMALLDASRNLAEVIGSWSGCVLPAVVFEPASCWALRTGHPHLVTAGDSTAPCAHAAGVKNSYLCIPILAQGETLGIVHLQATDEAPQLDESELSFKTTFAAQVGLSIANIRLREALRTQSVRDALTGLYNRRYLEETLEREVRRAARAAQSLGILMIDLDHFKNFNDTYGHEAGDAVLRETGLFLAKGIRAEDFVCRFGGEEFVVILPTADLETSRARAERLRLKMRELTIMYQGKSLGMVTISVGVAAFPEHGKSPKELMAAADAALYQAKRAGRDRVAMASPPGIDEVAAPGSGTPAMNWS